MIQFPRGHFPISHRPQRALIKLLCSATATWTALNQGPKDRRPHVSSATPRTAAPPVPVWLIARARSDSPCLYSGCIRKRKRSGFLPQIPDVVGGPREAHTGPAHHVDEIRDAQNVLRRLKGRVPSAQDQHGLASKILRADGHRLVTLNIF